MKDPRKQQKAGHVTYL